MRKNLFVVSSFLFVLSILFAPLVSATDRKPITIVNDVGPGEVIIDAYYVEDYSEEKPKTFLGLPIDTSIEDPMFISRDICLEKDATTTVSYPVGPKYKWKIMVTTEGGTDFYEINPDSTDGVVSLKNLGVRCVVLQ